MGKIHLPSAHKAHPEYEFNTVITTGISAPPMAAVNVTPIIPDIAAVPPNSPNPIVKSSPIINAPIAPTLAHKSPALMK